MELYATFAKERPQQILAVFIRDARSTLDGGAPQPIDDPTGATAHTRCKKHPRRSDSNRSTKSFRQMSRSNSATSVQPTMTPGPTPFYQNHQPSTPSNRRQAPVDYFSQPHRLSSTPSNDSDSDSTPWLGDSQIQEEQIRLGPKPAKMPDAVWERLELQARVDKARMCMPQSVKFRLFTKPEECVEAFDVLDQHGSTCCDQGKWGTTC